MTAIHRSSLLLVIAPEEKAPTPEATAVVFKSMKQPRLNLWDALVLSAILLIAWGSGLKVLLGAIVAGLYFFARPHFFHWKKSNSTPPLSHTEEPDEPEPCTHEVENNDTWQSEVVLDVGLHRHPCINHFRYWSLFDVNVNKSEFEYRVDGTEVSIRLLEEICESGGEPDEHSVIDGVVQETALRDKPTTRPWFVEDRLKHLKESVEWHPLTSLAFNGLKYVILSRLNTPNSRKFLRQELERLATGSKHFNEQLATLGYPMTEKEGIIEIDWKNAPDEQSHGVNLADSLRALGITLDEFLLNKKMTNQLRTLLDGG
jgi:hypothetical protein